MTFHDVNNKILGEILEITSLCSWEKASYQFMFCWYILKLLNHFLSWIYPHRIKLLRSVPQDAPREVFAQLLPTRGKTRAATGNGLVTSVLAPISGLHGGNGAKQIDVIAR